jgi:hypothetical protein
MQESWCSVPVVWPALELGEEGFPTIHAAGIWGGARSVASVPLHPPRTAGAHDSTYPQRNGDPVVLGVAGDTLQTWGHWRLMNKDRAAGVTLVSTKSGLKELEIAFARGSTRAECVWWRLTVAMPPPIFNSLAGRHQWSDLSEEGGISEPTSVPTPDKVAR